MRKYLGILIGLVIVVSIGSKLFKIYKQYNLLSTEAAVNFYFTVPEEHIDSYFNLPKGTYNKNEHAIVCSFQRSINYGHNSYYNLSVKTDMDSIDCNQSFSIEKHQRFNIADIQNRNDLYIRIVNIHHPSILNSDYSSSITYRKKEIALQFGRINNFVIDFNSVVDYCK